MLDDRADAAPMSAVASADPVGEYVVRTRYFQQDNPGFPFLRQQLIQHARIAPASDGSLTIALQLCSQQLNSEGPFAIITAEAAFPQRWPERTGRFVLDGKESFHVELAPLAIGFDSDSPAGCTPGGTLPVSAARPWLSAPCVCPRSQDAPTSSDDCRVTDADGDGEPGVTIHVTGQFERYEYVRTLESSQIVEGKLAPDGRHSARFYRREQYGTLDCQGQGCVPSNPPVCSTDTTSVELARLPSGAAAWDCDAILEGVSVGRLLPLDEITFPTQCN